MELEPVNRPQTVREFREILGLINQEVELKSSCGMDYRQLRDFLAQEKWKEADRETERVMLAVGKREKEGRLGWLFNSIDIDNFPCEDLSIIDKLWVKYSDGKFGFSVQKRIYQGFGGTREYDFDIWEKFGDKVGWRKGGKWRIYNDMTFDKKAPEGHLPWVCVRIVNASLLSRRDL